MKRWGVIALMLLAAGGAFWWHHQRGRQAVIHIEETAAVDRGPVRRVLQQTGIVKAQVGAQVKIGARATGTIERMLVKVGDRVQANQLVARIDRRELELQRRETAARLRQAEAEAAYRQSNYHRLQQLAGSRIIAIDELEDARRQAEAAAAGRDAERAALAALDIRLSYTEIRSPIAGKVSQVTAQEGETVVAGLQVANLITVLDPTRLEMWIYVDETDVGQVKPGQPVEFRVDAYPREVFHGEVATIYPEPEIRDNIVYYQAIVRVSPEQAEKLRPEMTTQVEIVVQQKPDVLRLPNRALKWVEGQQWVFVQRPDGSVARVQPKLGLLGQPYSEVIEGLAAGDRVATRLDLPGADAKGAGNGRRS